MQHRENSKRQYLKDKKIILYRVEHVNDAAGFATAKYTPVHAGQLWAYVRQLSAREFYAAQAAQRSEDMLFVVNWRADMSPDWLVRYRGVFYNITRVDTFEGYKQDLRLYAAKLAAQPGEGDLLPFEA